MRNCQCEQKIFYFLDHMVNNLVPYLQCQNSFSSCLGVWSDLQCQSCTEIKAYDRHKFFILHAGPDVSTDIEYSSLS